MSLLTQDDLAEMKSAAMQCQSQDDYIRAIEAKVIARLATVSVEPCANWIPGTRDFDIGVPSSDDAEWGWRPLYSAEALAAVRVQAIEECAKAAKEGYTAWDSWHAIRALLEGKRD